ncbi:MAG: glycosyltransferase family 4 protein [Candidatus Omnitrophota bacterium]
MDAKPTGKIKILRIIARLNIGGPAIHCILLTEGLSEDSFESMLIYGSVENSEADMLYLAKDKGIKPILIEELGQKLSLKRDLIVFWKLFNIIRNFKPDIIHTHTAKAGTLGRLAGLFYNFMQRIRLRRNRAKLVHTFHGHIFYGYFGKLKSKIFILIERILSGMTDKIITVSDEVKLDLIEFKIAKKEKIIVIPLGLELEKLLALPYNDSFNSKIRVGIIGRLTPVKNHMMFFKAIKQLSEAGLSNEAKFMIIGDGELREKLEDTAKELGIYKQTEFTGWQKDALNLYSKLDIVALTSFNEGTPVSLIEAMAAARPVIATNVGGVKDIVNDERGFLVASGDVSGFAKTLKILIEDSKLRQAKGQAGRNFVRDLFTKERLIKDMETLYKSII